jgi:hypothetical protein
MVTNKGGECGGCLCGEGSAAELLGEVIGGSAR